MKKSKATPGPWDFTLIGNGESRSELDSALAIFGGCHSMSRLKTKGGSIGIIWDTRNAELISNAPKMEEFIIKVSRGACLHQMTGFKCYCYPCEAKRILGTLDGE